MQLVPVTAPTAEPLTAADARTRLGIGSEVSDAALDGFIKAARQTLDGWNGWLGRALVRQTWKIVFDGRFPCDPIRIPLSPLISIDSVKYADADGVQQTLASGLYQNTLDDPAYLLPMEGQRWPTTRCQLGAVEIQFTAGYGADGASVPEPIRSAIALMVSNLRSLSARNLFVSQDVVEGVGSKNYVVGGNAAAAIDKTVDALLGPYRVFA